MKNTSVSTGALTASAQIKPLGTRGMVTYAEAIGDTLIAFDGNGSGTKLFQLASGERVVFETPVRFTNGLYITLGVAGPVVLHIG